MAVFVLDARHQPLMPCSEKRVRLLLQRRAGVHRVVPFCIRLKDLLVKASTLPPVVLKIDPSSRTTGLALVRSAPTRVGEGEVHRAVSLIHLAHRGQLVHENPRQRAGYRRRRRSTTLRCRAPRFANRRRPLGWLPPSLQSRIGTVLTWARRFQRLVPLTRMDIERVKFDTALLQHPELRGVEYQRGELFRWEVCAYLLEKFGRRCACCRHTTGPFELDHALPRSRGDSDRASNLALTCRPFNQARGDQTATAFGHPEVQAQAQAQAPMRDAAAVNATRYALCDALRARGLPLITWSGGGTRWNRERFGILKDHARDALCVGDLAGVSGVSGASGASGARRTLSISATGRGNYQLTNVDASGLLQGYLPRHKRLHGFETRDLERVEVPAHLTTAGTHASRVVVRRTGGFRVGRVEGIPAQYCRLVQRADGYAYANIYARRTPAPGGASSPA